jgi:DNA-binding Lrp family transcriptional regulator
MVDERDFQLLANLLKEPLASNEELGRRVRLSGTAVKTRLERLTEEGVFGGLYGIPAPEVFQRQRHVYVFRGERVNATAPHKAIQIDPVVSVHLRQDGNLPAILYEPPGEAADPPEELVRTFGPPSFSVLPRPFQAPPKGAVLSPIDWRVMRPLIREPRMPIRTLAERTRLSPKTVRRHRDALLRDGALTIEVHVRGARARGLLLYNLWLTLPHMPARDRHAILTKLPRCAVVNVMQEPPAIYLFCRADSYADVLADEAMAKELAGADRSGLVFPLDTAFATDRLESWVDAELARWSSRRGAGTARS